MPNIHISTGEKGGVGKSVLTRLIIQFLLDHHVDFQAVETDRSNPDCHRLYSKTVSFLLCIFSESDKFEDSANNIFNSGLEKLTIVNTPAQIYPSLTLWFANNQILEIAQDAGVTFWIWFVTDGGYDSLNLLKKTLEFFENGVRYVVVRNEGRTDDFAAMDSDKQLQRLMKKYEASVITLPKLLGSVWRNRMDAESLTFEAALSHPECGLIDRQRIRRFLTTSYEAFLASGAFSDVIQPK